MVGSGLLSGISVIGPCLEFLIVFKSAIIILASPGLKALKELRGESYTVEAKRNKAKKA